MSFLTSAESPLLYHFNASCEMAVGNGLPTYTAPEFIRQFEKELELLPLYLAGKSDYLLLENPPSEQFLENISVIKPELPQLFTQKQLLKALQNNLPLNGLKPWGWSPAEHKLLEVYKPFCSMKFSMQSNSTWKADHKELYSRKTALNLLFEFIDHAENKELFVSEEYLPQICKTIDEVETLMLKWRNLVVKAPWSSSGRGLIVLCQGDFHPTYKKWINGVIKGQGYAMVEPMLDKVCDLSFHYEIKENKEVKFLGQASFSTTVGGQYIGNNVQPFPKNLSAEIYKFMDAENINTIKSGLQKALQNSNIFRNYTGVLGIDVLLYKTESGELKFQPCLEINLRQNMGTVALAIRNLLPENSEGMWQIKYFSEKDSNISLDFHRQMQKKHLQIVQNGNLAKGYLPLIEPYKNRKFALYLLID